MDHIEIEQYLYCPRWMLPKCRDRLYVYHPYKTGHVWMNGENGALHIQYFTLSGHFEVRPTPIPYPLGPLPHPPYSAIYLLEIDMSSDLSYLIVWTIT